MAIATSLSSFSNYGEKKRVWEDNIQYTRETVTVYNSTGAAVTVADPKALRGLPVALYSGNWRLLAAAAVVTADGVILEAEAAQDAVANNAALTGRFVVLARGPAVIVNTALAQVDAAAASIDQDVYKAALAGVSPPIIVRDEIV